MGQTLVQDQPRGPSVLVEVPVITGARRVNFPDIQQLRSQAGQVIVIKKIRTITTKILANGILNAAANMAIADFQNAVLVVYAEGWEKGKYIPLLVLNDMNDSDATAATTFGFRNSQPSFDNWIAVDWPQCYIQFSNGQAATTTGVFMFDVEYIKLDSELYKQGTWKEIKGPS